MIDVYMGKAAQKRPSVANCFVLLENTVNETYDSTLNKIIVWCYIFFQIPITYAPFFHFLYKQKQIEGQWHGRVIYEKSTIQRVNVMKSFCFDSVKSIIHFALDFFLLFHYFSVVIISFFLNPTKMFVDAGVISAFWSPNWIGSTINICNA